ncbi:MAG TPA: diadenylate cyclase CdaA [Treponemataceae bacterium]|nr:diadenylate cyclase CdaA [Treponemataceae bacterium]
MSGFENLIKVYDYIRPFFDVGILAFILYKIYGVLVNTHGMQVLKGVVSVVLVYGIALYLNLSTLVWLLNLLAPGLLIGFALVFQPELRKLVMRILQGDWFKIGNRTKHRYVDSVIIAAEMLSRQKRGMLAVFVRKTGLRDIIETGTKLDADLSSSLIVTIFGQDTPLHDGAIVIQGGKVVAASCFLPLSEQYDIKKTFGTRHRAALGLSEETDAVVLVVSEETGAITLCYDSKLCYDLTTEEATKILETKLELSSDDTIDEEV